MMGIETAIIGGVLGVGSSILSANATKKAASRAADAAQDSTDKQIALARETRDGQIARSEPFRQLELQQGNALGEIFGFNSVGDAKPRAPQSRPQSPSPYQNYGNITGGTRFNPNGGGGFVNGAARRIFDERGAEPSFNDFLSRPQMPSGVQPRFLAQGQSQPQPQAQPQPQMSANGINISAQNAARERFEGSMFNDVYRAGHARDVDRIDAGLGASGLAFSGARMQAVEDARADRFGSTFNSYFNGLMGQAPQTATNEQNRAAGAFGISAGNAIGVNGQAQQDSAYKRGEANAGIFNTAAELGGMAVSSGLSKLKP
ncbi:MAG: hypothetical protein ABJN69_13035 [Hellea sp.]